MELPSYAFYNWDNITKINLPNNIKSIGTNAFYDCNPSIYKIDTKGNTDYRYIGNDTIKYLCLVDIVKPEVGSTISMSHINK